MANPFPFSSGSVLTAAGLNQIADGVSFTPTWNTGVTVGNGTVTAKYFEVNELVFYTVDFALGSTSAITGDVRLEHPIQADGTFEAPANTTGFVYDASAAVYWRVMGSAFNSSEMRVRYLQQSGAAPQGIFAGDFTSSDPITFATNDRIVFSTFYRRA